MVWILLLLILLLLSLLLLLLYIGVCSYCWCYVYCLISFLLSLLLFKKKHINHFFINELTNSLLPWDRVRCYGPGVEPSGPVVGAPTHFTIETFSAGKGKVEALLHKPDGQVENVSNCHAYGLSLVGIGILGCVIMCTCRGRKG